MTAPVLAAGAALLAGVAVPGAASAAPIRPTVTITGNVLVWTPDGRATASGKEFTADSSVAAGIRPAADGGAQVVFDDYGQIPVLPSQCVPQPQSIACPVGSPADIRFGGSRAREELFLDATSGVAITVAPGAGADTVQLDDVVGDVDLGSGADTVQLRFTAGSTSAPLTVAGGRGQDTVRVDSVPGTSRAVVRLDGRLHELAPGVPARLGRDIENVVGGYQGVIATGNGSRNVLVTSRSRDVTNRLVGGGGLDRLVGNGGDDRLDARDGRGGDVVTCGGGDDRVLLDRGDRITDARRCESVTRFG